MELDLSTTRVPIGQIVVYEESFCDLVKIFCSSGLSLSAFSGWIGISRQKLEEWRRDYDDFEEACQVAKAIRTWALERQMMASTVQAVIGARRFALSNASPDEWKTENRVYVEGNPERPVTVAEVAIVPTLPVVHQQDEADDHTRH